MKPRNDPFGTKRKQYADELALRYPGFAWERHVVGGLEQEVVRVHLTPAPPPDELHAVLSDLGDAAPVAVDVSGQVRHLATCWRDHTGPPIATIEPQTFEVHLELLPPPANPRARIVSHDISPRTHPPHPHIYIGGWACPVYPPDRTWTWDGNTPAEYLHHVAIWLLKTQVWLATRRWIGPDVSHHPGQRPPLRRNDPCHCASGKSYRHCHRGADEQQKAAMVQQFLRRYMR